MDQFSMAFETRFSIFAIILASDEEAAYDADDAYNAESEGIDAEKEEEEEEGLRRGAMEVGRGPTP